jgi:23S rRNA pseudouridine1911/1915/1917 synthase
MSEIRKSFSTEKYVVTHTVMPEHSGLRLDQFVQACMPTLSRQFLKVHEGEKITITTYNDGMIEDEYWHGEVVPRDEKPTILFEDEGLLAVNKPPYMITHPAGKNLFYCATVYFETIYKKTIHSIHRLDRETSGVLLLGKNPKTSQRVSQLFEDDKVRKCYFFIAHKREKATAFPFVAKERMDREEGSIPRGIVYWYPENSELGKESETHFELLKDFGDYVLALAFPLTGRQHQIRVHASLHGYPLLGDKLYHGDPTIFMRFKDNIATSEDHEKMQIPRQALHAVALEMTYPDQERIKFVAPLPKDLVGWLESKLDVSQNEVESLIKSGLEKRARLTDT